jgi:hypothetical protein
MLLKLSQDLYDIEAVNFKILTLGFDDDGHLWNLPRTGAFVFHNTSCLILLGRPEHHAMGTLTAPQQSPMVSTTLNLLA